MHVCYVCMDFWFDLFPDWRVSTDDLKKCEDFIDTMRVLYKSTLCVSADKSATAGQVLPILEKLKQKFKVSWLI